MERKLPVRPTAASVVVSPSSRNEVAQRLVILGEFARVIA